MTLALADLAACFEGVIPSIIATAAPDGTPNISYLSTVVRVDDTHVGISNQFFSKTAANIRANARAALLVVDARTGAQYRLDVAYARTVNEGPLFEHMAASLKAVSLQVGMASSMVLRGVDIHRVIAIRDVRSPVSQHRPAATAGGSQAWLRRVAALVAAISEAGELAALLEAVLAGIERELGIHHAMILTYDAAREELTTIASRGYGRSGIGSEVALGDGLIGVAALERRCLRINDLSRARRIRDAIAASSTDENKTRAIALPGLPDALSQLAMPIIVQGQLRGVIMLESPDRLAFPAEFETAMEIVARHLGLALVQVCMEPPEAVAQAVPQGARQPSAGRTFRVVHHRVDDSVFIDNEYIIKGVSGRLLMGFLATYAASGRRTFSNREIRADPAMRLPDLKDNLETRLLLLQRRLEERGAPVRLERPARGRILLTVAGLPLMVEGAG